MDEEVKKNYYTISEAAKIRGIDEEKLWSDIREGKIETKKIGMRTMMSAAAVFGDITTRESDIKAEQLLEKLKPYLLEMLKAAPEFGSCGIIITFHEGVITKVNTPREVIRLEEKKR